MSFLLDKLPTWATRLAFLLIRVKPFAEKHAVQHSHF